MCSVIWVDTLLLLILLEGKSHIRRNFRLNYHELGQPLPIISFLRQTVYVGLFSISLHWATYMLLYTLGTDASLNPKYFGGKKASIDGLKKGFWNRLKSIWSTICVAMPNTTSLTLMKGTTHYKMTSWRLQSEWEKKN